MTKLASCAACITDRGLERTENQDAFFASPNHRFFVVADGMGGTKGGAEASRLCVTAAKTVWTESDVDLSQDDLNHWLKKTIETSNHAVCDEADKTGLIRDRMGTTVVAAIQSDQGKLHIAHVGDSRAYLLRDHSLKALTNDHAIIAEMVREGKLSAEQAANCPWKSVLSRCLGHERDIDIDMNEVELKSGDWIIMCTDGLCGFVDDPEIFESVDGCSSPQDACSRLLEKTMAAGAPDNVTIVVIHYETEKTESNSEAQPSSDRMITANSTTQSTF